MVAKVEQMTAKQVLDTVSKLAKQDSIQSNQEAYDLMYQYIKRLHMATMTLPKIYRG